MTLNKRVKLHKMCKQESYPSQDLESLEIRLQRLLTVMDAGDFLNWIFETLESSMNDWTDANEVIGNNIDILDILNDENQ